MTIQPGANVYTQGFGSRPENVEVPHIDVRAPSSTDLLYPIGKTWVDSVGQSAYTLTGLSTTAGVTTAVWVTTGGGSGAVATLTGDSGTATPVGGNIKIAGTANQIVTSGAGSTVTLALTGPYTPATYTAHGVLIGEGTSSIVATAAGSTGQVLIGATGADPAFGALGVNSGLTAHGVLLGENTSAIVATVAGTTGQVLIGATGADPAFGALGVNSGLAGIVLGNTNSAFTTATFVPATAFTPAFSLGTPGDSVWTYSSRVGRYEQVGGMVFFTATLTWSNFTNTTGSGNWQVNLPVTAGAFANAGQAMISGSGVDASAETANLPANFLGVVGTGATVMVLSVEEGGIGNAANALFNLTVTQVLTAGTLNISGWYFAA